MAMQKQFDSPLSLPVQLAQHSWLRWFVRKSQPKWNGTLVEFGHFVWIHRSNDNPTDNGMFGKGTLSRSKPTWFSRLKNMAGIENDDTLFPEHLTMERRRQRRNQKAQMLPQDNESAHHAKAILESVDYQDMEQTHLDFLEAFFLAYATNSLAIHDPVKRLSIDDCWARFRSTFTSFHALAMPCASAFTVSYAVYHYYRSLGWAPKQGAKFGVDFVLYRPGPKHNHADFAVIVMPTPCSRHVSTLDAPRFDWHALHRVVRVCTQIKKTLILCHVTVPDEACGADNHPRCLKHFKVREVILKRWSPEKNRK